MNDREKEHVLHKIVASSAFLFALCVLPVAQHFLVSNQVSDSGQVQGASTDSSITNASIPAADCSAEKIKETADLDKFLNGKKIAMVRDYENSVKPYREAIKALAGTPESIATETKSLNGLIDDQYSVYLKKLSDVDGAVASQKNEIESRSCAAE